MRSAPKSGGLSSSHQESSSRALICPDKRAIRKLREADFSLLIFIATWKFLDFEALGQDWQDLLAKQMYPDDSKGLAETCAGVHILISPFVQGVRRELGRQAEIERLGLSEHE
jgi:hypothetical protein